MVNEASFLSTGYSTYGKEVLTRLHNSGKYEIAELMCYGHPEDTNRVPWKAYANLPDKNDQEAIHRYNANATNAFGEWRFEEVVLDFQADFVMGITDFWMLEYEQRSPYRHCYRWTIMPTCDSSPQSEQWLDTYSKADGVLSYQDWSGKVLCEQSNNQIKWFGSASPSASEEYQPYPNKAELKSILGLGPDIKVVGTVMRNQRRKLYPDLFKSFRKYLDQTKRKDVYLYCHTSYPDNGWDIPLLIKQNQLSSKVFFTYVCQSCQHVFPSLFKDAVAPCPKCKQISAGLASVRNGVDTRTLAGIINLFDLCIQYANSEGFGIPMIEAAACAVPVAATDYSAMSDVVRKLDGYPIRLLTTITEPETGCERAVPDNDHLVEIMTDFFNMPEDMRKLKGIQTRKNFEANYSWDKTVAKWMELFDSIPSVPYEEGWGSSPRYHNPIPLDQRIADQTTNRDYARWLILNVLGEPDKINTYFESRIIRDLNYQMHIAGTAGLYYNEESHQFNRPHYQPFNRQVAYDHMVSLCNRRNHYEQLRERSIRR